MSQKPVIFLTFANDHHGQFLEALRPEQAGLHSELAKYQNKSQGIYHSLGSTEPNQLLKDLNEFTGQLIIFHYSGHADGEGLQLESLSGDQIYLHGVNLTSILEGENNLKLVFLNGCATKGLVEQLHQIGVPAVIATETSISDQRARDFAIAFYRSLVSGKSLEGAFLQAKALIEPQEGNHRVYRSLIFEEEAHDTSTIPWGLYVQEEDILGWQLSEPLSKDEADSRESKKSSIKSKIVSGIAILFGLALFLGLLGSREIFKRMGWIGSKASYSTFSDPSSFHILLLPFGLDGNCEPESNQYHKQVHKRILALNRADTLNLEVIREDSLTCDWVDIESVKSFGNILGADLVIYGNYEERCDDTTLINVQFVLLDTNTVKPSFFVSDSAGFTVHDHVSLPGLRRGAFTSKPEEVIYWVAGMREGARNNYKKALKFFSKITVDRNEKESALVCLYRGFTLKNLNLLEKSIEAFNQALDIDSLYKDAYNGRGSSFFQLEENEKAVLDFSKVIALDSSDAIAYSNRGAAYKNLGKLNKALNDHNKAISIDPSLAFAYDNRGSVYAALGDFEASYKDHAKALELEPNRSISLHNLAVLYFKQGNHQKAIEYINEAIRIEPEVAKHYSSRGYIYAGMGRLEESLSDHQKAIEISPNSHRVYSYRGASYVIVEKFELALEDMQKAVQLGAKSSTDYHNRGVIHYNLQNYQKAILDLSKAIDLGPIDPLSLYYRGMSFSKSKQYQRAISDYVLIGRASGYMELEDYKSTLHDYHTIIDSDSFPEAFVYNNMGVAYFNLNQPYDAILYYSKAIELDSSISSAFDGRGIAFYQIKKYLEAVEDHSHAIRLEPNNDLYYAHRASASGKLKQYQSALLDFNKSISINPKEPQVFDNRGSVLMNLGQYTKAISDHTKAIELDPNLSLAYNNRGTAFAKNNEPQKAIQDYSTAIKINPRFALAYTNRAFVYQQLGKTKEAEQDLQMAKSLGGENQNVKNN